MSGKNKRSKRLIARLLRMDKQLDKHTRRGIGASNVIQCGMRPVAMKLSQRGLATRAKEAMRADRAVRGVPY